MAPPLYSERFEHALTLAARLHHDQRRKGTGVPYITHLLGVAAIVGDHGGTEDQVIAALLHDALEDQLPDHPDLHADIRADYGEHVLTMVEALSDTQEHPKPPWKQRKTAYIEHVRALPGDAPALLISAADKLYNARTLLRDYALVGEPLWERFKASRAQTLWYYRALADSFEDKEWPTPLQAHVAHSLADIVDDLEAAIDAAS